MNDPSAKTCYQCAAALPQPSVENAPGDPTAVAMAQLAEAQAKVGARPKPAADAPETDGDLLARLQEIRRVLGSTDMDQPGARSGADRPGSAADSPPAQVGVPAVPAVATAPAVPAAQAVQLAADERFDLGTPFPEGTPVVRRWRPTVIVGVVLLAVAAAVWYGLNRERSAPTPASSGVVTDRAGAPAAPRPIEPPADKPAAPVTAVAPVTAPAPTPSPPVAAEGKAAPPAAKGVATSRPEAPGGEAPRLRLSAPPAAEASPPSPPQPTAAVRIPAEKAAAVPAPPAPKAARPPQAGGSPAPGVIERQPAYTGQCNEGAAALGLCAPAPSQRRE